MREQRWQPWKQDDPNIWLCNFHHLYFPLASLKATLNRKCIEVAMIPPSRRSFSLVSERSSWNWILNTNNMLFFNGEIVMGGFFFLPLPLQSQHCTGCCPRYLRFLLDMLEMLWWLWLRWKRRLNSHLCHYSQPNTVWPVIILLILNSQTWLGKLLFRFVCMQKFSRRLLCHPDLKSYYIK